MTFIENLFEIIENKENIFKIKFTNKEHPIFQAHFPNNHILPGFLQIDISQLILKTNFKKIKRAKFMDVIKPNDIVEFNCDLNNKKIVIFKESKKISEFSYE